MPNGLTTLYRENGNVASQINYVDGKMKGIYREYHENGKLSTEGHWNINNPIGEMKSYTENGELQSIYIIDSVGEITSEKILIKE